MGKGWRRGEERRLARGRQGRVGRDGFKGRGEGGRGKKGGNGGKRGREVGRYRKRERQGREEVSRGEEGEVRDGDDWLTSREDRKRRRGPKQGRGVERGRRGGNVREVGGGWGGRRTAGFEDDDEGSCEGRELGADVGRNDSRRGAHFKGRTNAIVGEKNANTSTPKRVG